MKRVVGVAAMLAAGAFGVMAQPPGPGHGGPPGRPGMGPAGRWWADPAMIEKLSLTGEQQKKLADIFQQNRLKLIELSAAVQKEEAMLEPMLAVDRPDEAKATAQIDRVAQARADLEKANGRMLLSLRSQLTPEQWRKLQAERPGPGRGMGMGKGGPGPGGPPRDEE